MSVKQIAVSIIMLLVLVRASCENRMMNAHGPDAQMGIWVMLMGMQLLFWLLTGMVAAKLLAATWPNRWRSVAAFGVLMVWVTAVCLSSVRYYDAGRALFDASTASTSPERLGELVGFDGIQSGYELDNRIASHPNTPPEVLRSLHGRLDQVGTEMCLAQNPNTPEDILLELANRNDDWAQYITDSLKRNPKYDKVFGNRD
jgi:hypothetical protein